MRTTRYLLLCLVLVAAPAAAQETRDPLPVPDIPGFKTLKCDFHMHTVFSDGAVWPNTRVHEAFRDGLDAIAITDHSFYNPKKNDVRFDLNRPDAVARDAAEQLGVILVKGVEVNAGIIHFNSIFVKDAHAMVGLDLKEALVRAKQQGAFSFWNHPGWRQTPQWFPLVAELHKAGLFGGMELVNGADFYPEAYPWVEEHKLAIMANSDEHEVFSERYGKRGRPVTLVFARTADEAGLQEALKARRSAAWMNGEVWGFEEHLAALWSGAVKVERPEVIFSPRTRAVALMLRNGSALPFRLKLAQAPSWLRGRGALVRPEAITGMVLTVGKDAPAGTHRVELEFEVTNFHTGPGRNLTVKVPLTIAGIR